MYYILINKLLKMLNLSMLNFAKVCCIAYFVLINLFIYITHYTLYKYGIEITTLLHTHVQRSRPDHNSAVIVDFVELSPSLLLPNRAVETTSYRSDVKIVTSTSVQQLQLLFTLKAQQPTRVSIQIPIQTISFAVHIPQPLFNL